VKGAEKITANTTTLGRHAEKAAAGYFIRQGYQVIAENYLVPRLGELDLVLYKNEKLTIVEVKARSHSEAYGGLAASITPPKLEKLRKAAWCFLKEKNMMNTDVNFLAAFVEIDNKGNVLSLSEEPIEWV